MAKRQEELQESIDIARAEINRLDSIVTQFLRAIRPSKPQLHPENVNAIVEETVRFFAPEIKDRDIVVEAGTALRSAAARAGSRSDEAGLLQRDQEQLRSDEAPRHFAHPDRPGRDARVISFTDTGGGISAENLSRRFRAVLHDEKQRLGSGLLIVRRIVREHGGEMAIESSEGSGLTLTFRLPLSR